MKVTRLYHGGVVSDWRERERSLRDAGVEVTLISARQWNEGGQLVRLEDGDGFCRPATTLGHHPYGFVFAPRPIIRALRERPDVIDVHEEPASLAAAEVLLLRWLCRTSATPIVFYSAQNIYKRHPPPFRWLERAFLRRARAAYVCNTEAVEVLRRKGFTGEVAVVPLGVDPDMFDADTGAGTASSGEYMVGYVGRLDAHKGVAVLIDAIRHVPEVRLEVIGDGPQRSALERQVADLGLGSRVHFSGVADRAALGASYRRFDVLVVPSLPTSQWKEQFGRVAAEAMSVGTPVIASDSGSLPEVVGPGGLLVPAGDAVALGAALTEMRDPARRAALGSAARRHAESFRWEAVAAQQLLLYRRVVSAAVA